jgi:hypothetical protein
VFACDFTGLVTGRSQLGHDLDLEGLPQRAPGHLLEGPLLIGLHKAGHFGYALLAEAVDLKDRFLRYVLVAYPCAEPVVHKGAEG